jgi:endoglucanase
MSWADDLAASATEANSDLRLNTVGYRPQSGKLATIETRAEDFIIRDVSNGRDFFRGKLLPVAANGGNAALRTADFSGLDRPGVYRIEVPDDNASAEFRVANDIYNWPFYCSMRAMYLWRCGTAVSGEFNGDHFQHDACHLHDAYLNHAGGKVEEHRDGAGGWHDAGDYNKYTVNGAFAVGMMLTAWEHFEETLAGLKFDIPESDNSVPDFLDEVRWELDWLLKMQADDGHVYHKLSTLKFCGAILPHEEQTRRYFSPWSSAATADFVAIMAQASRVFRAIDLEFSKRCLAAAEKSYKFLQDHPDDHRPDLSAFSTGPYDAPDPDDRLWAAAEMWESTGEHEYLNDLETRVASLQEQRGDGSIVDADWDWSNVRNLGLFAYLLSERPGRDPALFERVRRSAIAAANASVDWARRHPYGRPLGDKYYWGCNGTVARQSMNLHVAYRLSGDDRYRAAMLDCLNHLFGRNPFGRSYVTGLGDQPPLFPHDRRSGGDNVKAPWPGYLVGGPWPNATDWYDVYEDYRTNEVAINWNGALIYALAAFVEPNQFDASISAAKGDATRQSSTGR